jgi:tyrosyl-tRNA synthetase
MSKSWGNAIWISDSPDEMFGKVMSLHDDLIVQYFINATKSSDEKIKEIEKRLKGGENPLNLKKELGVVLVTEFHSKDAAEKAQKNFEQTFQERAPEFNIKVKAEENAAKTLIPFSPRQSMSSVKELIRQGAIDINGEKLTDGSVKLKIGDKIKVGDRTFLKVEK